MFRPDKYWYNNSLYIRALLPLSWLFCSVVKLRRLAYQYGIKKTHYLDVPVIIVGNITVGGTGKTPTVIWLVNFLKGEGYSPGIVSRGYGGKATHWPQQVRPDSDPVIVGDEAILLAHQSKCPVAVGPKRVEAARALLEHENCDIIISDDGLQHYSLGRDIEIALVDSIRRFGNGHCLPAGPLREPEERMEEVDIIVANGVPGPHEFGMRLAGIRLVNVSDYTQQMNLEDLRGQTVHAVAGIGYPERFFNHLNRAGLDVIEHPFQDHHVFKPEDLDFGDDLPVIMTEKDIVKCHRFTQSNHWYLPVKADPDPRLGERIMGLLKQVS